MASAPHEAATTDSTVSLRTLAALLGRKRRVWLATGVLGLLIGAALPLVLPQKYSARTDLYLSQPANQDPTAAMADNVSLLETQAVAKEAIAIGHLDMSPATLMTRYSGLGLSNSIMEIKASGSSKSDAVAIDRDLARAYLRVQAEQLGLETDAAVRGLQSQITSLNEAIDDLNVWINGLSSGTLDQQWTNQLTNLVNRRGADESQVTQLQSQVQQETLGQESTGVVNHVLDPATLIPSSTGKAVIEGALSGLVVGLAVGIAVLILGRLLREPVLDRATVATTLGAPVELSLGRYTRPRVMRKIRLARQLQHPSAMSRMIERRLRANLESAPGSSLAVIALGDAEPAALAVGALALDLSSEGREVTVVDVADDRPLAFALGLTPERDTIASFRVPAADGSPLTVLVAPADPAELGQKLPPKDADAVVVLASLDPAFGAEHLASWVTDAIVILSPRGVTPSRMQVSRHMLREAGISLRAVVLLGSDPWDDTSGTLSPTEFRLSPEKTLELSSK